MKLLWGQEWGGSKSGELLQFQHYVFTRIYITDQNKTKKAISRVKNTKS